MGSLCSKSSNHSKGDSIVLRAPRIKSSTRTTAPRTLGAQGEEHPDDPRAAAALAAEQRLKAAQTRGTNASNPNQGRLAAQLEATKSTSQAPEARQQDGLVWD